MSYQVKRASMSDEMQRDALQCVLMAEYMYKDYNDIANYIAKEFDRKHQPKWFCIVGSFGCHFRGSYEENHRRDNRGPHPEKGRGEPGGGHPAATMQTPQGVTAASPQAPPAVGHTRADRPGPGEPRAPPPPSRGPAKPSPTERPSRAGQRPPEHPAPEPETTNAPAAGGIPHRQGMVVGWALDDG
ncbi:hypothetical protein Q8A67_010596 [Cirrhinus molitorella]|uniref:Dynein light chain n=1 Tax=Cirrhinus molitorella TaxID=172907 RepID=A0AA88TZ27_9TELE|nr:hypothetical protein Q8A67_010596 [Cirrhinus molitorella]